MANDSEANKARYRVALIGAGRIGCGFDAPTSERILTHAHAIRSNPRTELSALVEKDTVRGNREAARWGTALFEDIGTMWDAVSPDIVVIATPDETHAELLEHVAARKPKLIICEKPVVVNDNEAALLRERVPEHIPVVVNFSRRFDPSTEEIRRRLDEGKFGRVLSAHGMYTGGLFHNGSHMIDLARFLFGEVTSAAPSYALSDAPGESSIGGFASFERCPQFHLSVADARAYAIFELDILLEKKRIRFIAEGANIAISEIIPDPVYDGFRVLGAETIQPTELVAALPNMLAHALAVLENKESPRSDLDNALKTHAACMRFAAPIK